jgi:hypothetical protein
MQIALAWLLQRSPNILLIPGTSSVKHLRENLEASTLRIPTEALIDLDSISKVSHIERKRCGEGFLGGRSGVRHAQSSHENGFDIPRRGVIEHPFFCGHFVARTAIKGRYWPQIRAPKRLARVSLRES